MEKTNRVIKQLTTLCLIIFFGAFIQSAAASDICPDEKTLSKNARIALVEAQKRTICRRQKRFLLNLTGPIPMKTIPMSHIPWQICWPGRICWPRPLNSIKRPLICVRPMPLPGRIWEKSALIWKNLNKLHLPWKRPTNTWIKRITACSFMRLWPMFPRKRLKTPWHICSF